VHDRVEVIDVADLPDYLVSHDNRRRRVSRSTNSGDKIKNHDLGKAPDQGRLRLNWSARKSWRWLATTGRVTCANSRT
jgi:hypothetical protein